ncbi:hypothetical protein HanPSC8_Chr15g0685421 [Helianthus annuus]|nr:hypothetical protein HanPSC8_Chr15g0685421 [Helianthus annuus]
MKKGPGLYYIDSEGERCSKSGLVHHMLMVYLIAGEHPLPYISLSSQNNNLILFLHFGLR